MTLKELLGDSYSETMTLADVDKALAGKKFVDLETGKYVDKDKYNKLQDKLSTAEKELADYKESTKDYETLKSENETFKTEKADNEMKSKLTKLGISDKFYKYVKSDIADGTLKIGDDEKTNKDAVAKYLKDNPSFATTKENHQKVITITPTKTNTTDENKGGNANQIVNDNIRNALLGNRASEE